MEILLCAFGVLIAASMIAISMISFTIAIKALARVNELERKYSNKL